MKIIATGTPIYPEAAPWIARLIACMKKAEQELSPSDYREFLAEVVGMLEEETKRA